MSDERRKTIMISTRTWTRSYSGGYAGLPGRWLWTERT